MEENLAKAGIFQGVDPDSATVLGDSLETVEYPAGQLHLLGRRIG